MDNGEGDSYMDGHVVDDENTDDNEDECAKCW